LLGCRECAKNRHALQSKKVTHVLTVAQYKPLYINHFKYKIVPVADANEKDLCQYFEDCVKFIDEARSAGGVLVHCR
jgi:dual specificity phosphatase 12